MLLSYSCTQDVTLLTYIEGPCWSSFNRQI